MSTWPLSAASRKARPRTQIPGSRAPVLGRSPLPPKKKTKRRAKSLSQEDLDGQLASMESRIMGRLEGVLASIKQGPRARQGIGPQSRVHPARGPAGARLERRSWRPALTLTPRCPAQPCRPAVPGPVRHAPTISATPPGQHRERSRRLNHSPHPSEASDTEDAGTQIDAMLQDIEAGNRAPEPVPSTAGAVRGGPRLEGSPWSLRRGPPRG